ncbi:hypothetical protein CC86DRAFT_4765 [Ophiobolus disseminans]|uniref:Uncharacterized protein n=1 Tax=Ophiobolus disseminans TaxID=1469910 RepID=A0A6A7AIE5_9PLEO|nr:hypothetical protein CC86DRAFT_4765 [Ophiobolus disseminans]
MASTYHLNLAPATIGEDVLGIAKVSGFYGPGNWAAWLLTIAASWIAIWEDGHTQMFHVVTHVLYTNWAAVDLLRQLRPMDQSKAVADSGHHGVSNHGPVAAAFNVTYWGLLQIGSQYVHVLLIPDWQPNAQRRRIILLLGQLLPSLAGAACLYYIHSDLDDRDVSHRYNQDSPLLPMLYHDDISQLRHQWSMYYAFLLMAATCFLVCIGLGHLLWIRIFKKTWKLNSMLAIYIATVMPMAVMFRLDGTIVYLLRIVLSGGRIASKSCFFMPCAPQRIDDWDQSFTLFVALFVFTFEHGSLFLKVIRGRLVWVRQRLER